MSWFAAFVLTQLIELPIWLVGLRGAPLTPVWRFGAAFAASALTHPVLHLLQPSGAAWLGGPGYFVVGEAVVFAAEAAYITGFRVPWRRAVLASAAANGTSALVGVVLIDFVL